MCRDASVHVTVGGAPAVKLLITAPWQVGHPVSFGCAPPGGSVWQLVPHSAWEPSTVVQFGVSFLPLPAMVPP